MCCFFLPWLCVLGVLSAAMSRRPHNGRLETLEFVFLYKAKLISRRQFCWHSPQAQRRRLHCYSQCARIGAHDCHLSNNSWLLCAQETKGESWGMKGVLKFSLRYLSIARISVRFEEQSYAFCDSVLGLWWDLPEVKGLWQPRRACVVCSEEDMV